MRKNQKRFLTKRGKIMIAFFSIAICVALFFAWAHAINVAAKDLRDNPAFRVVDNCKTRNKNPCFHDYIITEDFKLVPCE